MASEDGGRGGKGAPDTLDLLWGIAERPRRGPRPGLTPARVVEAAVAVADAEGLEAVTMQRTARALGYTTMSLYRYVSGKDQLVELMVDAAVGDPPDLGRVRGGWREEVRAWARAYYRSLLERPWLCRAPVSGPPRGPRSVAWLEVVAGPLLRAGLDTGEMLDMAAFLSASVQGVARLTSEITGGTSGTAGAAETATGGGPGGARRGVPEGARDGGQDGSAYAALLRRAADTGRYPVLATLAERGELDDFGNSADAEAFGDLGSPLEFALDRLIEGIAVHGRRTSGG